MTYVRMTTSAGEIDINLYTEDCPETTENFLKLVDDGFYDGLHFLRVIKDFMIQILKFLILILIIFYLVV